MFLGRDLGYWMGWAVAAGMGIVILLVVFGSEFYEFRVCTGSADEQCLREWFSALGGWAGVSAAALGVLYLRRQIEDAQHHQKANSQIQLFRPRSLAKRCEELAKECKKQTRAITERIAKLQDGEESVYRDEIIGEIEDIIFKINTPEFKIFEEAIQFSIWSPEYLTEHFMEEFQYIKNYDREIVKLNDYIDFAGSVLLELGRTEVYFGDIENAARKFIDDTNKLI